MAMDKYKKLVSSYRVTHDLSWYKKFVVSKLMQHEALYKEVEESTGVPSSFIMALHVRENAQDVGRFKKYLGNGQSLSMKTTIVPRGRGPFSSWKEGAVDALRLMGLDKVKKWDVPTMCYLWERYNGMGYSKRGINSPYVWSKTNHYTKGHFVADGKFSSTAVDKNIGCMALYDLIVQAKPEIAVDDSLSVDRSPIVTEKEESLFTKIFEAIMGLIRVIFKPKEKKPTNPDKEGGDSGSKPAGIKETDNLKILKTAINEIGVKEVVGKGNNKQIVKYHSYARKDNDLKKGLADSVPWCASFICYVLEMNGISSTNSMAARSFLSWGESSKNNPMPGDIVVFWRGSKTGWQGHVGVYLDETTSFIYVLGGNQSDSVNVNRYSKSKLLDIRRAPGYVPFSEVQEDQLFDLSDALIANKNISFGGKVT